MAVIKYSCVVTFAFLISSPGLFGQVSEYEIPEVSIQPLKPKGVRISMPDSPKITLFAFHGHINKYIGDNDVGEISCAMYKPENGVWSYQNDDVQLKVGDVIYYYINVVRGSKMYIKTKLNYTVSELFDPNQPIEPRPTLKPDPIIVPVTTLSVVPPTAPAVIQSAGCRPTSTRVLSSGLSKSVCSGEIIFEDNFDDMREDLWIIEQYVPSTPEYPFVSYQQSTVSVENGILRVEPQLQENLPGFDSAAVTFSRLDLSSGCTRPLFCVFNSDGGHILPPIASGRITSKHFSFKYGYIEVRARVPQGDWLYPDIILESLLYKYGPVNYASGILRIAGVLGNLILNKGREDFGNKVLYGGPIMDFKCRTNLLVKKISSIEWGNDFHVYSLRWAPEMIVLFVDGEEWGRIEPPTSGLQTRLPRDKCDLLARTFLKTPIAPFDDYFRISLGVSAGGVSEFPDGVVSLYTIPKPWINTARRARLNFFRAKDSWLPTWTQPALLVDYIKVRAL